VVFLMVLGLPVGATANLQAPDYNAREYYPLEFGNSWIYGPRSSVISNTTVISHSIQLREREYFIQETTWFDGSTISDTLRYSDDNSSVVRYWYGIEYTLYNFELHEDSVYTVPTLWPGVTPEEAIRFGYEMHVARTGISSRAPFADHAGAYGLVFDILGSRDAAHWMTFIPEIGLVYDFGIWHDFFLISANVDGTIITDVESSPPNLNPHQADFAISPNPSQGLFSVTLTPPDLIKARVEIYDLLGRRLESRELSALDFSNGSQNFDLSRASAGTYLVRVTQGRSRKN